MFTIGPDHGKKLVVGLNYLPPLSAEQAEERYRLNYTIPAVSHGTRALFMVGGPGGHTEEFVAVWKKAEAAFKEYPARSSRPASNGPNKTGNPSAPAAGPPGSLRTQGLHPVRRSVDELPNRVTSRRSRSKPGWSPRLRPR
jgi:hypothetical protein